MSTHADTAIGVMTDTVLDSEIRGVERRFGARPDAAKAARESGAPVLDVVVPVYDEQSVLAASVRRLHW